MTRREKDLRPDPSGWALLHTGPVGASIVALLAVAFSLATFTVLFNGWDWARVAGFAAVITIATSALIMALGALTQRRNFSPRRATFFACLAQIIGCLAGLFALMRAYGPTIPMENADTFSQRITRLVNHFSALTAGGLNTAYQGFPPIDTPPSILWLVGVLAVALSLVMLTFIVLVRAPLTALVIAVVVASVPLLLVVTGPVSLTWICAVVALALVLFGVHVRPIDQPRAMALGGAGGLSRLVGVATAGGIAVLVGALVASNLVMPRPLVTVRPAHTIGLTLTLGEDLREPVARPVLEVATTGAAPYLRIGTLTQLTDGSWVPDPVSQPAPTGVTYFNDFAQLRDVTVTPLATVVSYAPSPYPLLGFSALNANWQILSQNLTIQNPGAILGDQPYTTVQDINSPTLDEMLASLAVVPAETYGADPLNADVPHVFYDLALEATADAHTDVEKAQAIERYLRTNFSYSLSTPAAEGYDSSDVGATERFIEVGAGYCVHFSSAFALMARSIGLPTRIVVGYTPGGFIGLGDDDTRRYRVYTDQAHAWPEVHFEGIGWVAFEPTASIGSATSFDNDADDSAEPTPTPTASDTPTPTPTPTPTDAATGSGGFSGFWAVMRTLGKILGWALVAATVLGLPAIARTLQRKRRESIMHGDEAGAAANASWQEVRATLVDAGIAAPAGETIRQFGTRMRSTGVAGELVDEYTSALEAAAYKPGAAASDLAELTTAVRKAISATVSRRERLLGILVPKSLMR